MLTWLNIFISELYIAINIFHPPPRKVPWNVTLEFSLGYASIVLVVISFQRGEVWAAVRDLANQKARDIHGLKFKCPKSVANDLCESITTLYNVVAR